jgi:hypothetical protein
MGVMELSEMRDATRWGLDNRRDLTATQLNRWINWSYLHICQPHIHRHQPLQTDSGDSVTLVTDQIEYDLDALLSLEFFGVYSATYIEGTSHSDYSVSRHRLHGGGDVRWMDQQFLGTGRPNQYAIWGGSAGGQVLYIDRRPTSNENGNVLLIRGYRRPARLDTPTDVTVLNEMWDEIIILGARWRGWRELNRLDRAGTAQLDFSAMLTQVQDATKLDAQDWGGRFELDLIPYQMGA